MVANGDEYIGKRIRIINSALPQLLGAEGKVVAVDYLEPDKPILRIELDDEVLSNGYYYHAKPKHIAFIGD